MTGGTELSLQENEETKAASVSLNIAVCAAQTCFPRTVQQSPNDTRLNVSRKHGHTITIQQRV